MEGGVPAFIARNTRQIREAQVFACAEELRATYDKVGAAGFCYGGWACFRLSSLTSKTAEGQPLVDCIVVGHPSLMTERDFDEISKPTLILAPENDEVFTMALKDYCFSALQRSGAPFSYLHFPGVEHAFAIRGDPARDGEREAMVRAKDAAVFWFSQFLCS